MKKRFLVIVLSVLMAISIPVTVYAATPRAVVVQPILQFNGMTAICAATITASQTDMVEAEINLWKGSVCLETWSESATCYITFKEYATVQSKGGYTLTVDVTINGVYQGQFSDSATCS